MLSLTPSEGTMMDLNELYFRHQLSVVRATSAPTFEARHAHRGLAAGYARRIAALQSGDAIVALASATLLRRDRPRLRH
ncbi:hypothetical protein [Sphingomonas sp. ABOLG]|uniref:hypothetical protein n=1 Tax=Sphingomonas sp. ABOLG TaxID=1985880 RepID=UPI0011A4C899|nr:hypothetical protein [Sphingomonas sp. ABOLG]